MISFAFTDEQEDYRRQLRRFAETELAPKYRERAAKDEFPWDAHRQLGELGVLSIGLPEEYGGAGATDDDPITLGIATEALAYGDVNVGAAPVQVGLVASQLAHDGQPSVAREWVPKLITGEVVAAIAVTEPSGGSDAVNLRTTARKVDGGWLLNGEKIGITHATTGQIGLVYAREPGSQGSKGVSCFLVPLDSAGVTRSRVLAMGCLPLGWGGLSFEDVFVPEDHLIGEEGRGFAGVMGHFDFSRPALGLLCLGAAQASVDEAVGWAKEREAFGRPLAAFQGVSFPLAEHATYMEAARWLCYRALWTRTVGGAHTQYAAMSKWWPPIVAKDAIETALVTFGNLGYSTEMSLQQRLRDVTGYLIGDGTAGIQKRIIATTMFGRVAAQ
jgi:cyclohexanecarboxyl-CoA dehydrogenase